MTDAFDPIAYINEPRWRESKLGLHRIRALLNRMGRPQDSLRFVHVAGTNGKGSTCAFLSSILAAAGYEVGLFTSPYVEEFAERIRVGGENIGIDDLTRATLVVRDAASQVAEELGEHPTEFELMFAVALEHFRTVGCDIVVAEVGLGGRLDATNVIDAPEASVITRIGLDHTALLGDTIAEIAAEKAGIVKEGVPVASWPQAADAAAIIEQAAALCGCVLRIPDFSQLEMDPVDMGASVRRFRYRGAAYETKLLGSYQPGNAALAVEAVGALRDEGWNVPSAALEAGIAAAFLPGRFEVAGRRPLVIVDGGHNPQGAVALADSLADVLGEAGDGSCRRVVFAMGVLADKDYRRMIDAVLPFAAAFVAFEPENPRALDADELARVIEEEIAAADAVACDAAGGAGKADAVACDAAGGAGKADAATVINVESARSPHEAVERACDLAGAGGIVVAFGSLYAVSAVKAALAARIAARALLI